MEIRNRTPLPAALNVVLDKRAAEWLVLCAKGTWTISDQGRLALAAEQDELHVADVHAGEPGASSVIYEADVGPPKLATDCALVGSAVPPRRGLRRMEVSFRVGRLRQRARVVGERRRTFGFLGWWWTSGPKPLERTPLRWELAVGGTDLTPKNPARHSLDLRNPLGRGFRARGSKLKRAGAPLPQMLHPAKAREPVGFGFTGGHWRHRRRYAGTYDAKWQEERCPLLPLDFDERFFNSAAPGLTADGHLEGGEPVEVRGCTRGGTLAFQLPPVRLASEAVVEGPPEPLAMHLDTVTVDTDAMKLLLTWRGAIHIHRRLPKLRFVTLDAQGLKP